MLEGHSGSKLERRGNVVEKKSSYLAKCKDQKARGKFLIELSKEFPFAPRILEIKDGVIKYEYVPGSPGFDRIDLYQFGTIVRRLHSLTLDAPSKDTGIQWLHELAKTNLKQEHTSVDLEHIVSELDADAPVIVHGEITDVVVDENKRIAILDWDEAGAGSRYQDIGYVYFKCHEQRRGYQDVEQFLAGYNDSTLDQRKIQHAAGLIALAYARFANKDARLQIGLDLLIRRGRYMSS